MAMATAAAGAFAGFGSGAAFSGASASSSNSLSAAADWKPPTINAAVLAKSTGGVSSWIRQGGAYFVYADVSDTGNPAATPLSVTANVASLTTGQTAATLSSSGGPWTVGGVSYAYRASLTATNPVSAGAKSWSISATDGAANAAGPGTYSATVDNVQPAAADVQTINKAGGTAGKPETGDKVVYTWTEANGVDPQSILPGWDGTATTMKALILNNFSPTGNDALVLQDNSSAALGTDQGVDLGSPSYVSANATFSPSTMVLTQSGSTATLTVTLGTLSGSTAQVGSAMTMNWAPASTAQSRYVYDYAGNAISNGYPPGYVTESGASDVDF